MTTVALEKAQKALADLIENVKLGERVLITQDDKPVAEIIPVQSREQPPCFGSARGLISIADDFDAPLPDFDEYTR